MKNLCNQHFLCFRAHVYIRLLVNKLKYKEIMASFIEINIEFRLRARVPIELCN